MAAGRVRSFPVVVVYHGYGGKGRLVCIDQAIDNLRSILCALGSDLAMLFHAYFDESGTSHNSMVTCVAGYVFETPQLLRLEEEWKAILAKYGITRFHMVECAHRRGEFEGWTPKACDSLARELIGLIKLRARLGVVASLCESEFATSEFFENAGGSPGWGYVFCLNWCMTGVAAWASGNQIEGEMSYFFEQGHSLQKSVNKTMDMVIASPILNKGTLYHSHTFIRKDGARAIQAADILAWQWHREWVNRFGPVRRPRRRDFDSLLAVPHLGCHMTPEDLMAQLATNGQSEQGRRFDYVEQYYVG